MSYYIDKQYRYVLFESTVIKCFGSQDLFTFEIIEDPKELWFRWIISTDYLVIETKTDTFSNFVFIHSYFKNKPIILPEMFT